MKLAWVHYAIPGSGIARGYLGAALHLYRAILEQLGPDLIDAEPGEAAHPVTHLHFCPPHFYRPAKGKRNVLFTMWEAPALPREFVRVLAFAQAHIVPSEFCRKVWESHGVEAKVVPLGVAAPFLSCDATRSPLAHQLRVLWVGSTLERKGWPLVGPAWRYAFEQAPGRVAELTIKTIGVESKTLPAPCPITVDGRDLELPEMVELYRSHDIYLCTSIGEGFGLTVLEAMAAGCLALSPIHTGLEDFLDDLVAVRIPMKGTGKVTVSSDQHVDLAYRTKVARPEDIGEILAKAVQSWGRPGVEQIRQAGILRARRYTWEASARALLSALAVGEEAAA